MVRIIGYYLKYEYRKMLIKATLITTFMTFFEFFDFPIYWPLLVFYFIFMTTFLCRYKIEHMIKYKYIPFDFGKKTYGKGKSSFKDKN
jgi:hypothetical protein